VISPFCSVGADMAVIRLSPGLRYRAFVHGHGASGHSPPGVKWMAAMRVLALRKPLARVMRALTWAFSAPGEGVQPQRQTGRAFGALAFPGLWVRRRGAV
jgi:hypothetical protein